MVFSRLVGHRYGLSAAASARPAISRTSEPSANARNSTSRLTARELSSTKKPRESGASAHSGGGIRTRDLRVMSSIDTGAVTRFWLSRAKSDSPRSLQICAGWYENWYETKLVSNFAADPDNARASAWASSGRQRADQFNRGLRVQELAPRVPVPRCAGARSAATLRKPTDRDRRNRRPQNVDVRRVVLSCWWRYPILTG